MKAFYSHLIIIEDIHSALGEYEMDQAERQELLTLAEQILHHHTLNVVLNHLPPEKHSHFLEGIETDIENTKWLEFIKAEIKADVELAIKTQAEKIKKEILVEIKRSKRV
jgi:hypothetical protein